MKRFVVCALLLGMHAFPWGGSGRAVPSNTSIVCSWCIAHQDPVICEVCFQLIELDLLIVLEPIPCDPDIQ